MRRIPGNPVNPTSVPPSNPANPNDVKTAVFMDFANDAQTDGERVISNDRYKSVGFLLDTPTEKAPPGCEDANAQTLRVSRASGLGGFLSSAKGVRSDVCNNMPVRMDFARPARTVKVGFTGLTPVDYTLTVQFLDGQTEVLTAKATTPGAVVIIPFEAPAGKAIKSVTFWHANPDPKAKDVTALKSVGFTPA